MSNHDQTQSLDVVEQSALEVMERAAIDVQITTAKRYPRVLTQVKTKMLSLATLDQETAAGCFFTLPPRKGGDGKPIQGPSIRMAEIALASYGHIRAGARVIANDGKVIVAQGVVHDLENNVCISTEVRQRITTKTGLTYSDDMQVTAGNAACSKALRNATFRVVPLAMVKPIYEEAKRVAVGDGKTLATRRATAVEYFLKMGITKERIFAALNVGGIEDVTLAHLEVLTGYRTAIADGDTSIDEVFPEPSKKTDAAKAGPSGGITAAADGAKKEQPEAQAQTQEEKKPEATPAEREQAIDEMKMLMLDNGVSENRVFEYAKRLKLVPEGVTELFALPTAALVQLKDCVVPLANAGKAGAK